MITNRLNETLAVEVLTFLGVKAAAPTLPVLEALLAAKTDFGTFFAEAPAMNPNRFLITGMICGYRVEEIEDPFMREIRHLDKLVDEVSKGKAMEKVLRAG